MLEKYRHYFNIDPEYFPQVNEAIINENQDIWKKYYPHESFVRLMKDTVSVISRKQKVSIWVEGAYGTGKSHAVLTLKKLLDSDEDDTREYFEKYKVQLSNDLFNKFQQLKNGEQKILTVHRYGSSSIRSDGNLVFAIQNSIINALKEKGIKNNAQGALKDATVKWLSQSWAKEAFNALISAHYEDLFSGDNVDSIIIKLNTYEGDALQELMSKIMRVADENQFKALTLDVDSLVEWIKAIIKENDFKAIVFIWDEFTEYFRNNMRALTGFQKIADLSGSDPFYLVVVTHNVTHIFHETDNDWKKILGRFISPICNIELPENMAFRLMGAAMEKSADPQVASDWKETAEELYDRTNDSRQLVKTKASISDIELKNILPVHPYTALLLKHISSAFDSNQRSMFDFIKNDRGDEIKGFQWFIDNCGPYSENPLLTIDMLWDFFYEKGKDYLSNDIRNILDSYTRAASKNLDKNESRVLRTVLLLQAISQRTGDTVELFTPDEKNINNAFEGSDMANYEASRLADKLVRDDVLYKKQMGSGKFQYSAMINSGDSAAIDKLKEELRKKSTTSLVNEGDVISAIALGGALRLRYFIKHISTGDFKNTINMMRNQEGSLDNKIMAIMTYAKDDTESAVIQKQIKEALVDTSYHLVFIDASITPLGTDLMEQYVEAMANAMYQRGKDNTLANQYEANAKDVLKRWKNKIGNGEFVIYTADKPSGERASTIDLLYIELAAIDKKRYENSLESGATVADTMWMSNSLPSGVECGATRSTSGQYRSQNVQTKLENYIGEAWTIDKYWIEKPFLLISKIKQCVEDTIARSFEVEGHISIAQIYDVLKNEPYGFMPCNLSAFVIGFVLKEYADSNFSWSDGLTNDVMSIAKLKEMVAEIIKHQVTPIPRYKNKYIKTMTDEEKTFNEASAEIFNIPINFCSSVEQTRERIRQKMKELSFPIWCLKAILEKESFKNDSKKVEELIELYSGIANNSNFGSGKTDTGIALDIGKLCIDNSGLVDDLKAIFTKGKCLEAMDTYLHKFEDGVLISLAGEVGDGGQYINRLKKKFDADAANWVWNIDTAQQKIKEVILEYQIIAESNKILPKNITFDNTIREWCDKCDYIRISYLYAKNYWDELAPLMESLYNMKKAGTLLDSNRQSFLELIKAKGIDFISFYSDQTSLFKKACNYFVEQFSNEEIKDLFKTLPTSLFTREKADYQELIEIRVEEFKSTQGAARLKALWNDRTNSESPRDWSKQYKMPILCMISDKDIQKAKTAFGTISRKYADASAIETAIDFLNRAEFFDRLEIQEERDKAFQQIIVKTYATMLSDMNEVRTYLDKVITSEPYDWFGLPEVDKKLYQMAEAKYNQSGCNKALEKIENMDVADVKRYLKDLIKDNMVVGMEIIKDN